MFTAIKSNLLNQMIISLEVIENYYQTFYPGQEIVIIYKKKIFRILVDGKLKETVHQESFAHLLSKNKTAKENDRLL